MLNKIKACLETLRDQKPVILNITNIVTMDFMANALLALGAAPIMSVDESEFDELIQLAAAVNINIGTLDNPFIKRCLTAIKIAKHYQKPIILDPVGVGASQLRTQAGLALIDHADIIKGNASEILALHQAHHKTYGVDAIHTTDQATQAANALAKRHQCVVVVSGDTDVITDGEQQHRVTFGHPLMAHITGMGCTLTAVIAAFSAVEQYYIDSAYVATTYFGLCGTLAGEIATSPGTYRSIFIDTLYQTDWVTMQYHLEKQHEL